MTALNEQWDKAREKQREMANGNGHGHGVVRTSQVATAVIGGIAVVAIVGLTSRVLAQSTEIVELRAKVESVENIATLKLSTLSGKVDELSRSVSELTRSVYQQQWELEHRSRSQ